MHMGRDAPTSFFTKNTWKELGLDTVPRRRAATARCRSLSLSWAARVNRSCKAISEGSGSSAAALEGGNMIWLKLKLLSLGAVIVTQLTGCCSSQPEMQNGPRPQNVRGWQESQVGAITIKGQFVLNKGESTDNGRFGVRVLDIYPWPLSFVRRAGLSDHKTTVLQDAGSNCDL